MKTKLVAINGDKKETIELSDELFNIQPNEGIIHNVVCSELANRRQGTSSTKDRSEVTGSNRKPWRQKGTGRARAGSVKSPIWRGGGVIFGPKPRDYSYQLPKKMKHLSIKSVLSKRNKENRLQIVEDILIESGKTKEAQEKLFNVSLMKTDLGNLKNNKQRKKMRNYNLTVITDENNQLLRQGTRNLPWVKCLSYNRLNSYDLFYSNEIIVEKSVLSKLQDYYLTK